jgi:hypothetical protein
MPPKAGAAPPVQPLPQLATEQPKPPPAVHVVPKAAGPVMGGAEGADRQDSGEAAPKAARKAPKPQPPIEPGDPAALEKLVAAAKGYRPLYHHLETQIRRVIPGVVIAAGNRYVAIGAPREFAAITLHPTEIRLGLALGDRPFDTQLQPAKLRGPGAGITHMVVLTDARQVNDALLALVNAANARINTP